MTEPTQKIGERINNTAVMLDIPAAMRRLVELKKTGFPPGISTGFTNMDEYYKIPPTGQLNIMTGFPGSGKTEILDSIALNMVLQHDWKVFYYSPENYPPEYHLEKLCSKYAKKAFFGNWHDRKTGKDRPNVSDDDIKAFYPILKKNYAFIDCHINNADVDSILNAIFFECMERKVNMAIIDPWNKLESQRPHGVSVTEFVGKCLTRIQMFSREHNIHFWIIAHPVKPIKMKDGKYTEATLYDVADSAHWYNMADNGFIVHRTWEDKTGNDDITYMKIAKIKDRRYGKCGEITFKFDQPSGNFTPYSP